MREYSDAVFEVRLQAGTKRYKGAMIQRWRCGIVIVTAEVTVRWKDICWSADGEKAAAVSGGQQIRWRESALENWWF